jgi:hypothetical protein
MSNYTKSTNFATKDALTSGDPNKVVKGTEIDNEFNAISGAIASKADTASPALTGTPTAPTAVFGTNTTQLATTAFVTAALQAVYPVGSIYINAASTSNPSSLIGFGTWVEFGVGRVLIGQNASDALFDTLEETGGSKDSIVVSHTHTATSVVTDAGHTHNIKAGYGSVTDFVGGSGADYGIGIGDDLGSGYQVVTNTTGVTVATTNDSTGSSGTNANVQPYIVVKMWKRTA